jgi:hypothetical protein
VLRSLYKENIPLQHMILTRDERGKPNETALLAISGLVCRPYWSRAWVVQEIILATKSLPWYNVDGEISLAYLIDLFSQIVYIASYQNSCGNKSLSNWIDIFAIKT